MIIARIDSATASAKLWYLMRKMRDPTPFYKISVSVVLQEARAGAHARGGRTLWNQIADAVRLKSVTQKGPELECVCLWGRIGIHKEHGGPIRAKKEEIFNHSHSRARPGKNNRKRENVTLEK